MNNAKCICFMSASAARRNSVFGCTRQLARCYPSWSELRAYPIWECLIGWVHRESAALWFAAEKSLAWLNRFPAALGKPLPPNLWFFGEFRDYRALLIECRPEAVHSERQNQQEAKKWDMQKMRCHLIIAIFNFPLEKMQFRQCLWSVGICIGLCAVSSTQPSLSLV